MLLGVAELTHNVWYAILAVIFIPPRHLARHPARGAASRSPLRRRLPRLQGVDAALVLGCRSDEHRLRRDGAPVPRNAQRRHGSRRGRMDGGHRGGEACGPQRHHRLATTPAFHFLESLLGSSASTTTADGRIYENSGAARKAARPRRVAAPEARAGWLRHLLRSAPLPAAARRLLRSLASVCRSSSATRDPAAAACAQGPAGFEPLRPPRLSRCSSSTWHPLQRMTSRPCSPKRKAFRPARELRSLRDRQGGPWIRHHAGRGACRALERRANLRRAHHQRQGAAPRHRAQRRCRRGAAIRRRNGRRCPPSWPLRSRTWPF